MVMADLTDELRGAAPEWATLRTLHRAWQAWRRRRADRIGLAKAGRLGPRLLEDMGLMPEQIHAAQGGWERLHANGLLVLRRR